MSGARRRIRGAPGGAGWLLVLGTLVGCSDPVALEVFDRVTYRPLEEEPLGPLDLVALHAALYEDFSLDLLGPIARWRAGVEAGAVAFLVPFDPEEVVERGEAFYPASDSGPDRFSVAFRLVEEEQRPGVRMDLQLRARVDADEWGAARWFLDHLRDRSFALFSDRLHACAAGPLRLADWGDVPTPLLRQTAGPPQ